MADKHEMVDVDTLEAVHRLLTSTDFATADQLVARMGSPAVARHLSDTRPPSATPAGPVEGLDPLPRRR